MAEQNPAVFLQAGSHPAEDLRRFVSSLMGDRPGIVGVGDLAVTQTGTPSMAVSVAGGRAFIKGTENAYQGLYFVEERGAKTVAIAPADSTNTRYDLVVARVKDASYSGTVSAWSLEVVTGTASATPAEPTVPPNCLVLARVTVGPKVTSITNANIADRRLTTLGQAMAAALRADLIVTAATLPASGDFLGQVAYETDTDRTRVWNGTRWRYQGDRLTVPDTASRDALAAYDGLRVTVTANGGTEYLRATVAGVASWVPLGQWIENTSGTTYSVGLTTSPANLSIPGGPTTVDGSNRASVPIPNGRQAEVEMIYPRSTFNAAGTIFLLLGDATSGVVLDGIEIGNPTGTAFHPIKLRGVINGDGAAHLLQVQGWSSVVNNAAVQASATTGAVVRFRYRIL